MFCNRIHFPDRNRIAGQPKNNKVVVRGQMADIENVRQRIRVSWRHLHFSLKIVVPLLISCFVCRCLQKEVPVEFIVDCRLDQVQSRGESSLIDHFSSAFGVLLRFYPKIGNKTDAMPLKMLTSNNNSVFVFERWRQLPSEHSRPTRPYRTT